jgi:hypothetical protein
MPPIWGATTPLVPAAAPDGAPPIIKAVSAGEVMPSKGRNAWTITPLCGALLLCAAAAMSGDVRGVEEGGGEIFELGEVAGHLGRWLVLAAPEIDVR